MLAGAQGQVLLVSSVGHYAQTRGGGLWMLEGVRAEQIDSISTIGIDLDSSGHRLLRALHVTGPGTFDGAVLD